jgi:2-dehydropantoate 2-reductase
MKIAIIGVGGVGGYFGGLLAKGGEDVTFVARAEQYKVLRKEGLTVESVASNFNLPKIQVVDSPSKLNAPDLILIATKTYDLVETSSQLKNVVSKTTTIITLQNGLDSDTIVKQIVPVVNVVPGIAYVVSKKTGLTTIRQTAGPRTLIFGSRKKIYNHNLVEIEMVLKRSGILASLSLDIEKALWEKFLWITTFAGMTSLCRSHIGPIVNEEETYSLYLDCLNEGLAVADREGVGLSEDVGLRIIKKSEAYRSQGSHSKSSMLIDLENRKRTEIDALNGTLVRKAYALGIDVSINRCIVASVKMCGKLVG